MGAFVQVVLFAAVLAAFIAWAIAALAAFSVVGLAPRGEKLVSYLQLGLWRFSALEARLGAGVRPHVAHYEGAFFVFFAVTVIFSLLSFAVPLLQSA